jgi:hypothetical protein
MARRSSLSGWSSTGPLRSLLRSTCDLGLAMVIRTIANSFGFLRELPNSGDGLRPSFGDHCCMDLPEKCKLACLWHSMVHECLQEILHASAEVMPLVVRDWNILDVDFVIPFISFIDIECIAVYTAFSCFGAASLLLTPARFPEAPTRSRSIRGRHPRRCSSPQEKL